MKTTIKIGINRFKREIDTLIKKKKNFKIKNHHPDDSHNSKKY